jgi:type I restriction enzyme, S subunit
MFVGEMPFATPGDLDGRLSTTERTLTIAGAEYARVVRAGSALVGCIGNIGKMAKTLVRCAFNQQINAVEWNGRVHDDYGIAALAFAIPQMMALSSSTVVPILNKSGFMKVELRVPPFPLQREFARRVTAVEALKASHRASLTELDALFASLQHRAFRGEL